MKNFNIDDVEIIENYPDFNPEDVSKIMLSIGWGTKEILDKVPDHARHHYYQEVDYYLLAKIGDKLVGELSAITDKHTSSSTILFSLMVHKQYQGKGIGRKLIEAFNKKFQHTTTWAITPVSQNRDAISFLEKFGFKDNSKNFVICTKRRREKEMS